MKNLTTIAKDNDSKYFQLRDKLVELNIIHKVRNRYIPTRLALENCLASESSRFGNEMAFSISYKYDEQKIMDHYRNNKELETDRSLPF